MITFEIIDSLEDLLAIKDQWRMLRDESPHTPFQEWSWHYSWWKNVGEFIQQRIFFMTVWDGSSLKLVLPLSIAKDGDMLQWSAREVSDYCDVLTAKDNDELIARAISKAFSKFSGRYIKLQQVRKDATVYNEISKYKTLVMGDDFVCPAIYPNRNGYEEWLSTLDRRIVSDDNRRRRRLNEVGQVSLKEAVDDEEISICIRKAIADKKDWLDRRGIKNILCSDEGEIFLIEAFQQMFREGYAHVTVLQCGDESIANHAGFVHNNKFYYYFNTWKYSWKNYAPGKLLMLDLVRFSHEKKLDEFDMLRGDEEYKKSYLSNSIILKKFEMEKKHNNKFSRFISNGIRALSR